MLNRLKKFYAALTRYAAALSGDQEADLEARVRRIERHLAEQEHRP